MPLEQQVQSSDKSGDRWFGLKLLLLWGAASLVIYCHGSKQNEVYEKTLSYIRSYDRDTTDLSIEDMLAFGKEAGLSGKQIDQMKKPGFVFDLRNYDFNTVEDVLGRYEQDSHDSGFFKRSRGAI